MCGVVLHTGKERRPQKQHGGHWLSALQPRLLRLAPAFGRTWKEVLAVAGFLIFPDIRSLTLYERAPKFLV